MADDLGPRGQGPAPQPPPRKARWPAARKAEAAAARAAAAATGGSGSDGSGPAARRRGPPPVAFDQPHPAGGGGWWAGGGGRGGGPPPRPPPPPHHAAAAAAALSSAFSRLGGGHQPPRPPPPPPPPREWTGGRGGRGAGGRGGSWTGGPTPTSPPPPGYRHGPPPPPPPPRPYSGGPPAGNVVPVPPGLLAGRGGAGPPREQQLRERLLLVVDRVAAAAAAAAVPPPPVASPAARPVLRPTRPPPGHPDPTWGGCTASTTSTPRDSSVGVAPAPPPPVEKAEASTRFAKHWSSDAVASALADGSAHAGTLRVHGADRSRGFVTLPGLPVDVFVRGLAAQNRAVDGDVVALVLLPPDEWWTAGAGRRGLRGSPSPAPSAGPLDAALAAATAAAVSEATAEAVAEVVDGRGGEGAGREMPAASLAPVAARLAADPDARPTAKVVAILTPSPRRAAIPGTVTFANAGGGGGGGGKPARPSGAGPLIFSPVDPRLPPGVVRPSALPDDLRARLKAEARDASPGAPRTLLLASLDGWADDDGLPSMAVTAALGPAGDLAAEVAATCAAEGVDASDFPAAALAELPPAGVPWGADPADLDGRVDLRPRAGASTGRLIFSIDPPTARDLDDALSITRLAPWARGGAPPPALALEPGEPVPPPGAAWRVGVHIADVAAFVPAGGALDAAAASRATSTYLVSAVVPMLPRALCEGACSLAPGADRACLSVDLWLDEAGESVGPPSFYRGVMRSVAQLAYGDAEAMLAAGGGVRGAHEAGGEAVLDDEEALAAAAEAGRAAAAARGADPETAAPGAGPGSPFPPGAALWRAMAAAVRSLGRLSAARAAARSAAGSLRLDNTKLSFSLDPASGAPAAAAPYPRLASHALIEEFMLAANMAAAHRLASFFPTRAVLRSHPAPAARALEDLAAAVAAAGGPALDVGSAGAIAASLKAAREAAAQGRLDPGAVAALTQACTKPMPLAAYVCAGGPDDEAGGGEGGGEGGPPRPPDLARFAHYALAAPLYTHFTSPIRRYADLLVHRLLLASLEWEGSSTGERPASRVAVPAPARHPLGPSPPAPPLPSPAWCDARGLLAPGAAAATAAHCNARKAAAKAAQDAAGRLYLAALLASRPAVVAGYLPLAGPGGPRFFDAFVPALGVEVRIHVEHHGRLSGGKGGGTGVPLVATAWDAAARTLTLGRGDGSGHALSAPPPLPAVAGVEPVSLPLTLGPLARVPLVVGAAPPAETGLPAAGGPGERGERSPGCALPPGGAAAGLRPELYAWIYTPGVAGGCDLSVRPGEGGEVQQRESMVDDTGVD